VKHYVLDSYAFLAYSNNEPGADLVAGIIQTALKNKCSLSMNTVNLSEIYYIILRVRGEKSAQKALEILSGLPVNLETPDKDLAIRAATFKAFFKMSLADAFAAAQAEFLKATLVTGDPEFRSIEDRVSIKWLLKKQ